MSRGYITYPAGVPCIKCHKELVWPNGDPVCGNCRIVAITEAFLADLRAGLDAAFQHDPEAP